MSTTQFLYYLFLCINVFITSVTLTDLTVNEIRLLNQIDDSQVFPNLVINVDAALNSYMKAHAFIETSTIRVIAWNKLPSSYVLEQHFGASFKIIKYDSTYQNMIQKDFDYTSQGKFQVGRTWERFVFARVPGGFMTLLMSYTIKQRSCWLWFWCSAKIPPQIESDIENFVNSASVRMFDKLMNPTKSIYSHRMPLISKKSVIQFLLVYHDPRNGYIEEPISSFADGLRQQELISKEKLSSCIVMIKDGHKSLHSIRHPIIAGHFVPNFHAYYAINQQEKHSIHHTDL